MQPVYQIPGDVLKAHVTRLSTALGGELAPGYLHALLFLSGVHAAFCYFKAAHAGSEFFINYSPSHHLDDGLVAVSRSAIKTLMQECRSRSLQSGLKLIPLSPPQNRDWLAVSIAFATIFSRTTKTVKEWLSKGDTEENKLRLSCGMGVESFFNQNQRKLRSKHGEIAVASRRTNCYGNSSLRANGRQRTAGTLEIRSLEPRPAYTRVLISMSPRGAALPEFPQFALRGLSSRRLITPERA